MVKFLTFNVLKYRVRPRFWKHFLLYIFKLFIQIASYDFFSIRFAMAHQYRNLFVMF